MGIRTILTFLAVAIFASPALAGVGIRTSEREAVRFECTKSVSPKEIGFLIEGVSPELRRRMEDPEYRAQQFGTIREMLAIACQAVKENLAEEPDIAAFLKFIAIQATARVYDRTMPKRDFKWITPKQISDFYRDRQNSADFESHFALGLRLDPESTPDKAAVRRDFAESTIAYREAGKAKAKLPASFGELSDFKARIGQAEYLSTMYFNRVLVPKSKVREAEIDTYIAGKPEYSTADKKAKAESILRRALAGEDFGTLARANSDDPGSKAAGGLYEKVPAGVFFPELEKAALALAPGEIAPRLVESPTGFHIVKLVRKAETRAPGRTPDVTYDFRHILISTMVRETDSPGAREIPMREFVRDLLETERERAAVAAIIAENPVTIGDETPATRPARNVN